MPKFLTLNCPSCAHPLTIREDGESFTCQACGAQHRISEDFKMSVQHNVIFETHDCPICGSVNQPHETFRCKGCGTERLCKRHMDEYENVCARCASEVLEEGEDIESEQWRFMYFAGRALRRLINAPASTWFMFLAVGVAIAISLVAFLVWGVLLQKG